MHAGRPAPKKCRQQFSGIFGIEHCIRQTQMLSCAAPDRGTGEKACHGEFHAECVSCYRAVRWGMLKDAAQNGVLHGESVGWECTLERPWV